MSTAARDGLVRLRAVPTLPVIAATFAILFVLVFAVADPVRRIIGCVLIAGVAGYCLARRRGGLGVFFLAGVPALTCTVLDDVFAWPRWTGLCFAPFALVLAWYEDHPDEPDEPVAPGGERR
ncbi:MAG: hypothetical protein QOG15_1551 [Solirubrobacteraceae bacterium]|nr:hypothetical protein [Solirubrobacteraceae bacterium]